MSLSNLLLPDASSDKTIYCHNVIADYDSSFTNIDLSGVATCSTAPTLGTHLCNKTYVDSMSGAGGDVNGPASSTDNAVARYDATTGKLLQNSGVIIDDSNNITGVNDLTVNNNVICATAPTIGNHLTNKDYVDSAVSGSDFIVGTTASTNNAIMRYEGALGLRAQNSGVIIDDSNNITGVNDLTVNGSVICATAPTIGNHLTNKDYVDSAVSGSDFIVGTTASTNNAIMRYEGALGLRAQNSGVIIDDSNNITGVVNVTSSGILKTTLTTDIGVSSYTGGVLQIAGGVGILRNCNIGANCQVRSYLILGDTNFECKLVNRGGTAPTLTNGTITAWSHDTAGQITINASATSVITFKTNFVISDNITVQITPRTASSGLYVSASTFTSFTVVNTVASPATFDYFVIACRA